MSSLALMVESGPLGESTPYDWREKKRKISRKSARASSSKYPTHNAVFSGFHDGSIDKSIHDG